MTKLHEKYGEVVRIAPDTLSYTCSQAWTGWSFALKVHAISNSKAQTSMASNRAAEETCRRIPSSTSSPLKALRVSYVEPPSSPLEKCAC